MDNLDNNDSNEEGDELISYGFALEPFEGGAAEPSEATSGSDSDEELDPAQERFDISLASTHSYMREMSRGGSLVAVRSEAVVGGGWRGRVPLLARVGVLFPGDTLPLLLRAHDAARLRLALRDDRLFALLSLDEDLDTLTGYGVLCAVYEAEAGEEAEAGGEAEAGEARCLARALHRCRLVEPRDRVRPTPRFAEVEVLGEAAPRGPVSGRRAGRRAALGRAAEALATPWPLFLYDMFDVGRLRDAVRRHAAPQRLEKQMPAESDPVALSWWAARSLALGAAARRALWHCPHAALRLHVAAAAARRAAVACGGCGAALAAARHVRAMSAHGVHGTYANPAGHSHDVVTTRRARGVQAHGRSCKEYSWFPGYAWTVLSCSACDRHVGWRFDAISETLRPRRFYGLLRHYVSAPDAADDLHLPFSLQLSES